MSVLTQIRKDYKATGSTTDNHFIRIVLKDGTTLRYTDAQRDLTTSLVNVNGQELPITPVTYTSLPFDLSAVGAKSESPSEVDLEGILLPLGFTLEQISQGIFEDARIYIFISNRNRFVEDEEKILTGFWGETTIIDGRYITKFTSLLSILEVDTSRIISQSCDAKFGGERCGVKLEAVSREELKTGFDFNKYGLNHWYDFSDPSTYELNLNSNNFAANTEIKDKVEKNPLNLVHNAGRLTTLNGLPCFDAAPFSIIENFSGRKLTDKSSLNDMFFVVDNPNNYDNHYIITGESGFYRGSNNVSGSIDNAFDKDLVRLPKYSDAFISEPSIVLVKAFTHNQYTGFTRQTLFGTVRLNSSNWYYGLNIGEALVYPALTNTQRREVIEALAIKWGISIGTNEIGKVTATPKDAALTDVIKVDGIPFIWFMATTSGTLAATEPTWNQTLGSITQDGDVFFKAIPARALELTVSQDTDTRSITLQETLPLALDNVYQNGLVEITSGSNTGATFIVSSNSLNGIVMNTSPISPILAGTTIKVTIGCDKTLEACHAFDNSVNFQGFPYLPTNTNIIKSGDKQ